MSLSVPPGDPGALQHAAGTLATTASRVGDLAGRFRRSASDTVSRAHWEGAAADGFSAKTAAIGAQVGEVEAPLERIAAALRTYAAALARAQAAARAAGDAFGALSSVPPKERNLARQDALDAHNAAWSDYHAAAAAAAAAIRAATGGLPAHRAVPPVPASAEPSSGEGVSLADKINLVLGGAAGTASTLTAPPAAWAGARLWQEIAAQRSLDSQATQWFSELVGRTGLAFDRGEVGWSAFNEPLGQFARRTEIAQTLSDAGLADARGSFLRGGLPDTPAVGALGYGLGALGVASDVLTIWKPDGHGAEAAVNRTAAGANAVATVTVLAGINAGTDWIPVVGEVTMVATGVYLAGDWAYNHVGWFHDGVDATARFVTHDVPHFVTHDVPDALGSAAHSVGHFVTHDIGGALADLNPF